MNKKIHTRIIGFILAAALALSLCVFAVGCKESKLSAPSNVTVTEGGLISWDKVDGAEEYLIETSLSMYVSYENSFQLPDLTKDCTITVTAKGNGYEDSDKSDQVKFTALSQTPDDPIEEIAVSIPAVSSIKSEEEIDLRAVVHGTDNQSVTWELVNGSDFAKLLPGGKLKAEKIENKNQIVTVRATSVEDPTKSATSKITVVARHILTQEMLDAIKTDKLDFSGMLDIDYYTTDIYSVYEDSAQISVRTGMNATDWYASYENNVTGMMSDIFYRNVDGMSYQVMISLKNDEELFPMYDENRHHVSWYDSGLYNTFKQDDLKLSDFTFNENTWRYDYKVEYDKDGKPIDPTGFMLRTILSANPYQFIPKNLSLIIDEGEIMGIYSESEDDYTVATQYLAKMKLTVGINAGDGAVVKTISRFEHVDAHDKLAAAIEKMNSLETYKVDFMKTEYWLQTSTYTFTGYEEYVSDSLCYFRPYNFRFISSSSDEVVKTYTRGGEYGYKKINDNLYNAYYYDGDESKLKASRAYNEPFSDAMPSMQFAAEIFTSYLDMTDEDGKKYTAYFADESMMTLASELYKSPGTDMQLYGVYAAMPDADSPLSLDNFTPYVVVDEDGYIVSARFYYYLYYFYGIVDITFSDFDKATLPEGVNESDITFETRLVPSSWNDVKLIDGKGTADAEDDEEVPAVELIKEFFGLAESADIDAEIPFFGNALGDCLAFGMTTGRKLAWESRPRQMLTIYYDVLLDLDYSIDSSIEKIEKYIMQEGFTLGSHGIYEKDDYRIQVVDNDLDLYVYVWSVADTQGGGES